MRSKPRDHRYGETASSPGSEPWAWPLPKGSVKGPAASTRIVCPAGETRKRESPCPTSRTFNSSQPRRNDGTKGCVAIRAAALMAEKKAARLSHKEADEEKRRLTERSSAATKNKRMSQRGGAGIR